MARKDLLRGLLIPKPLGPDERVDTPATVTTPRMARGAIGAVGQSIADLRARSVLEVAPELIDNAGYEDRLEEDAQGLAELAESIRVYGQQVPVLLRHSRQTEGRYEVVYGRRRVAALKLAGLPVKAMLRDLTDRDLVIAQGQENALRKDLSFIEKVNFARQMRDNGFERSVICDALGIDKTVVSRMLTVADSVPSALIQAIGAAPSVGRDRWLALVERLRGHDVSAIIPLISGQDSDARFEGLFARLAPARAQAVAPQLLQGVGHSALGKVVRKGDAVTLTLSRKRADGFDDWLVENFDALHLQFLAAAAAKAKSDKT